MDNSEGKLKKRGQIITICLWILCFTLFYMQYFWAAFSIVLFGCFLRLVSEKKLIKFFLKKYFFRFYQVIIISVSYFLSIHLINRWLGIENTYLIIAPWVMAVLFSSFLFLIFMALWNVLYMVFNMLVNISALFVSKNVINKLMTMPIVRLSDKSLDLAIISVPLCFIVATYSNEIIYTALRLDAYSASDCGQQKYGTVYIRKNYQECYMFTSWFSTAAPELIQSAKK